MRIAFNHQQNNRNVLKPRPTKTPALVRGFGTLRLSPELDMVATGGFETGRQALLHKRLTSTAKIYP